VPCQVGVLNWGQITTNTQDILTNSEKATNLGVITSLCRKTAPVKTYIILSQYFPPRILGMSYLSRLLVAWTMGGGGGSGGVKKRGSILPKVIPKIDQKLCITVHLKFAK